MSGGTDLEVTLALGIGLGASILLVGPVAKMLTKGLEVKNYRGENIPTAMGIVLLLAVLVALGVLTLLGWQQIDQFAIYSFWLTLVCLAGLLDDAAGSHSSRGFRGHFSALLQGELTTGMAKVLIISGGAGALTLPWGWQTLPQVLVLLLTVNLFNQLDLRPGRSLKFFILFAGGFALGGNSVAAAGAGGAIGLVWGDLKARYMLGDAGANLLGALAGLAIITELADGYLWLAMTLLALANAAGEMLSFTRMIESNALLSWFDGLGRRKAGD